MFLEKTTLQSEGRKLTHPIGPINAYHPGSCSYCIDLGGMATLACSCLRQEDKKTTLHCCPSLSFCQWPLLRMVDDVPGLPTLYSPFISLLWEAFQCLPFRSPWEGNKKWATVVLDNKPEF